jgi:hypothetical protein
MTKKLILQRTRHFFSVEGEGEQSVIKWIQELSDQNGLHVHLDCEVLKGGGYKTMLERAIRCRKRKERQKAKSSILLVDGDRAERDDGWSLSKLRQEALKHKIIVCIQHPNLEGFLLRLMPGKECLQPNRANVQALLRNSWPNYKKPADTRTLSERFTLADLLRVAKVDEDLGGLLKMVGLMK